MHKRLMVGALVLALAATSASAAHRAKVPKKVKPAAAATVPVYDVVHGWPDLPEGEMLGSVAGVAVDSRGQVFVFHRSGRTWPQSDELDLTPIARPTVTAFDASSGAVIARWGTGTFAMPHGLSIDQHDNLWLTDVALQQVYKYSKEGRPVLTLGVRGVAGNDATHFNRPTAVAVAADGSFYVSDGYRNTRVMKFSAEGRFQYQWGTKGAGPGQFDVPHGIVIDATGNVYVADRGNRRVQVFDATGRYLRQWAGTDLGRPYALAIDRTFVYVADGGDQPDKPPDRSGWTLLRTDGKPLARFGRYGNYDGQFAMAHSIAVDADGAVYVGDIDGGRVQKFVSFGHSER